MKRLLPMVLAASVAAGCATSGIERTQGERIMSRYEPYVGEPVRSFTAFRQEGWQPISRNQLILWTSINDAYLLTISNNCPNLMFTNAVSVTTTTSAISTLDFVNVRGDRCQIQKIQPIDVREWRRDRDQREQVASDSGA